VYLRIANAHARVSHTQITRQCELPGGPDGVTSERGDGRGLQSPDAACYLRPCLVDSVAILTVARWLDEEAAIARDKNDAAQRVQPLL
jgi:hypothetical protein